MQGKITTKVKRNTLLSLVAAYTLSGMITSEAKADSPFGQTAAEFMTPAFFKSTTGYSTHGSVNLAEKKEVLKKFKKEATAYKFPSELTEVVSINSILNFKTNKNDFILYLGDGIYILSGDEGTVVHCYNYENNNLAEPLPQISKGINTITKKPYFSIPNGFLKHLSDQKFFKETQKILNTNFGTLMNIATLNERKLSKNAYAGKIADMPDIIFPDESNKAYKIDSAINNTLHRHLGYIVNGILEAKEIGEEFRPQQIHNGWTFYERTLSSTKIPCGKFIVLNGKYNPKGTIAAYRMLQVENALQKLKKMQQGFHMLMKEKGVAPQTNPTEQNLDMEQKLMAAWGNAFDNYISALERRGFDNPRHPYYQNQKMKSLDIIIGKENPQPRQLKQIQNAMNNSSIGNLGHHQTGTQKITALLWENHSRTK